jgi:threonine dehydrogenase-like Zn-dependent dehydrogenase
MGARVIAIETSPERRELALEKGAHAVIDPSAVDPVTAIRDLTHGEGAHKVIETAGVAPARTAAIKGTRKWGTACFIASEGEMTVEVGPDLTFRQVTLVGHWTFSKNGQADCARFVSDRKIDVDSVFTHQFQLEQADEAYKLLDQQKTGKGVFLPS